MNRTLRIALLCSLAAHILALALSSRLAAPPEAPSDQAIALLTYRVGATDTNDTRTAAETNVAAEPKPPAARANASSDDRLQAPTTPSTTPEPTLTRPAAIRAHAESPSTPTPAETTSPVPITPAPSATTQSIEASALETAPPQDEPLQVQAPAPASAHADTAEHASDPLSASSVPAEPTLQRSAVTTTAPTPASAPATALTSSATPDNTTVQAQPMAAKQTRMLEKKLSKWAASLHNKNLYGTNITWTKAGQQYTATFRPLAAGDDTSMATLLVDITTESGGQQLRTQVQMRRLAFSNFAQFVNYWNPGVMMHNDELDGRFHSNSAISLERTRAAAPRFHGKVTTSARKINVGGRGVGFRRKDTFLGGLETGVRRIRFPDGYAPLTGNAANSADQHVHQLAPGDMRIVFHEDGGYTWTPAQVPATSQTNLSEEGKTYLLGAPDSTLYISGTVNGRMLVYSHRHLVIEGHLRYAQDPQITPESDDFLGLVAEKNVSVAPPEVTGPGDLHIQASIYARGRFSVAQYRSRQTALLSLYGSLTAGSLSATEPRYNTKIVYDRRLDTLRAPGFPMTDRYEVHGWDRQWYGRGGR